ncbi:hypothetical protein [Borrelia miyamotoi]|uniref:hypothetical protein n=1 Tax=Borrelia miyamotoi TaxID=47466 RepID=UPI001872C31A|nr:hypothetical protein [Borrelia miyamotoi]
MDIGKIKLVEVISLENRVEDILIKYINGSCSNIISLLIGLFYDILIKENIISAI